MTCSTCHVEKFDCFLCFVIHVLLYPILWCILFSENNWLSCFFCSSGIKPISALSFLTGYLTYLWEKCQESRDHILATYALKGGYVAKGRLCRPNTVDHGGGHCQASQFCVSAWVEIVVHLHHTLGTRQLREQSLFTAGGGAVQIWKSRTLRKICPPPSKPALYVFAPIRILCTEILPPPLKACTEIRSSHSWFVMTCHDISW